VAHTGFGRVTRELATGLIALGHDVRVIGINHRGITGEIEALAGKIDGPPSAKIRGAVDLLLEDPLLDKIVPALDGGDDMGHYLTGEVFAGRVWKKWKPEAVICVADPRLMFDRLLHDRGAYGWARTNGVKVLNYVPIEGTGLPSLLRTIWDFVEPVAMSDFGQQQLQVLLDRPVERAWHGVSDAFRPITPLDPATYEGRTIQTRDAAKAALGLPGRTIILRTDRFIQRKNYPAFFRVMRPVNERHPEVVSIIHTDLRDDDGRGHLMEFLSREPGVAKGAGAYDYSHPNYHFTRAHDSFRGVSDEELRVLYNAADLYVSPTMAEGFGLTLAESLACGTPVVATDYSAITEVVGPGGILIQPRDFWTNAYAHEWALVDEVAMSAAVERLISKPAERKALGEAGRRHVARFSWKAAVEAFDRLLTEPAATAA
jgi:glycosyltransferase involved in cell wall biosynthesis